MLEKAVDRVSGQISAGIHNRAVRRLPDLVRDLVNEGLDRWAANSWYTFDDSEVNCSSQLFRWLREARRNDSRFFVLEIDIENIILTPGMLKGTESVTGAARPDFRISVRSGGVLLEAKRLTDSSRHCRAYVYDGMARFVGSTYGADESWGIMVGYVQGSATAGLQSRLNNYVSSHSLMGSSHQLASGPSYANSEWLGSTHHRASGLAMRLDHVWAVLS